MIPNSPSRESKRSWIFSCMGLRQDRPLAGVLLICLLVISAGAEARDLRITEAIDLALEHDYGVKAAMSDSGAARLEYAAARARRFPSLSIEARSSRKDEIPSLDLEPLGISREIGSEEIHQADATLSLPLFTGGRISGAVRATRETSLAEAAKVRAQRMGTAYKCRRAYLEMLLAEALVRSAKASLSRLEAIGRDVGQLHESGMADSIDIFEAEIASERGRQALAEKLAMREITAANLKSLTGLTDSEAVHPVDNVEPPAKPLVDALDRSTSSDRPEVDQLAHMARAAEHAVTVATADNLPSLAAIAGYSIGMPNQDLFNNDWNDYMMVGVSLTWDFNLGGATVRTRSAARERARSARLMEEDLLERLALQREIAVESAQRSYATMEHTGRQLKLARRRFALAEERQRAGLLSVNRLIEMEDDLQSLEEQYRASIIDCYLAETDYFYSMGSTRIYGGLR
ncbi:MAG: TolC family protein [Candidatus Eisenbacteria bacterium]